MEYLRKIFSSDKNQSSGIMCLVDVFNKAKYQTSDYLGFLRKINRDILNEKKNVFLAEMPLYPSPVIVDIDLRSSGEVKELYDQDEVLNLIKLYSEVLYTALAQKPEEIKVILLEKEPRIEGVVVKHGFHLHFVSVSLEKNDLKLLNKIMKEIFQFQGNTKYFEALDDVSSKPWLLYGAKKSPEQKPYLITKGFVVNEGANGLSVSELKDFREMFIGHTYVNTKIDSFDDVDRNLVPIMSIRNSANFSLQVPNEFLVDTLNHVENKFGISMQKIAATKAILKTGASKQEYYDIQDDRVAKLVISLPEHRSDNYNDWVKICMILTSLAKTKPELEEFYEEVFDIFSQKSSKYSQKQTKEKWDSIMASSNFGIGIGTLFFMAKEDKVIDNICDYLNDYRPAYIPNHDYKIARMVKNTISEMYITNKDLGCYRLEETIWVEVCGWENVFKNHISKWGKNYIEKLYEQELSEEEQKILRALDKKLNNYSSLTSIAKSLFDLYYSKDLENINKPNERYIAFKNCVFDIEKWEIVPPNPKHLLSTRIEHDLMEWNDVPKENKEFVNDFLKKIFPNEELREYTVKNIARFLTGKNSFKQFQFWTGFGDNGKSIFVMLLESIFGRYTMKSPKTLITEFKSKQGGANPELFRLKDARVVVIDELTKNDVINPGSIKVLSGNDKLYGRDLYQRSKDISEISPMFFPVLITNEVPIISKPDAATWGRIRLIRFESKFVHDVESYIRNNPEQNPNHVFKLDIKMKDKLHKNAKHFLAYFVSKLMEHDSLEDFNDTEYIPDKVSEGLRNFKEGQNILRQYIEENFVVDSNSVECISINKFLRDYNNSKPKVTLSLYEMISSFEDFCNNNPDVVLNGNIIKGLCRVSF